MPPKDPTADYRKYAKGPNFGLVVALFCVTILVVVGLGIFFLHKRAQKMPAHTPNPTPNSMLYTPPTRFAA